MPRSTPSAGRNPILRASRGAIGASAPKQRIGIAVRIDAPTADRPVSPRRSFSTGPTLATVGRRLIAMSTTPTVSATGNATGADGRSGRAVGRGAAAGGGTPAPCPASGALLIRRTDRRTDQNG